MENIASQNEISIMSQYMKKAGVTPPDIINRGVFTRFNTDGCLNNSGYYYLTEGIRRNKDSYLMASFGCFDRGINERVCTLYEKPEGEDESFYSSSHKSHLDNINKQKALYLDELNNKTLEGGVDVMPNLGGQTHKGKQDNTYSAVIEKADEPVVNSFVMYDGFYAALGSMPDDKTRLEYLDTICYYGLFRKTKEQSPYIKTLFALIKPQMDINFKRRKDGANGGRPKKVKAS